MKRSTQLLIGAASALALAVLPLQLESVALGSLQLLVESLAQHGFSSGVAALAAIALVSAVALWKWEARAEQPILPLDMSAKLSRAAAACP